MKMILIYAIALVFLGISSSISADINNPVYGYKKFKADPETGLRDSVLTTKVFFDQNLEYYKKTKVSVEHYLRFDVDNGLVIGAYSNDITRKNIILDNIFVHLPGKFHRGDTIHADFYITPRKVGFLDLSFAVSEYVDETDSTARKRISGGANTNFNLAPNGKLIGLQSEMANWERCTTLGPNPDLFDNELYFSLYPKPDDPQLLKEVYRVAERLKHLYLYGIEVNISRKNIENNNFSVDCLVSPYQPLEAGIAMKIYNSSNILVSNLSPSITSPVDSMYDYNFSFDFETVNAGIGRLTISFDTKINENDNEELKSLGIRLYYKIDESGNLEYLTDREPLETQRYFDSQGLSASSTDDRFRSLVNEAYSFTDRKKSVSEGYKEVTSI